MLIKDIVEEEARKEAEAEATKRFIEEFHETYTLMHTPLIRIDKAGPNEPCPCGSGKKYKKCCMSKENHKYERKIRES